MTDTQQFLTTVCREYVIRITERDIPLWILGILNLGLTGFIMMFVLHQHGAGGAELSRLQSGLELILLTSVAVLYGRPLLSMALEKVLYGEVRVS